MTVNSEAYLNRIYVSTLHYAVMRESEEGEKVIHFCHICGTKPSNIPLTADRFEKPYSFSFIRGLSALCRKNQSHISYCFLDKAARKLHTYIRTHRHTYTDRQTHIQTNTLRLLLRYSPNRIRYIVETFGQLNSDAGRALRRQIPTSSYT